MSGSRVARARAIAALFFASVALPCASGAQTQSTIPFKRCGTGAAGASGVIDGTLFAGLPQIASMQIVTDSSETRAYINELHGANKAETITPGVTDIFATAAKLARQPLTSPHGSVYPVTTDVTGRFTCGGLSLGNYDVIGTYYTKGTKRLYSVHVVAQVTLNVEHPNAHLAPKNFAEVSRR